MIDEKFVFLAIVLGLFGSFSYLIATIKGQAKPNKITWFIWAVAPLITFAAQAKQGVGLISLMTLAAGIGPLFIFFASFLNPKAFWKITKFDLLCGVFSVIGLILWGITKEANLTILFSIIADGLATIPTIIKSYQFPETENYQAYLFGMVGSIITLLTIQKWNFAYYAFPLYISIVCLILFLLIKFKLGKKIKTILAT